MKRIRQVVAAATEANLQAKKGRGQSKPREHLEVGNEPANWRELLSLVEEMRKKRDAPVDTMGSEAVVDASQPKEIFRLQVLVSALLSSQTKDEITSGAVKRLQEFGLTVGNIMKTDESKIAELVYPVGFYKTKAKNLKKICEILHNDHHDDVPMDLTTLLSFPGIGPKMAHLILNVATGSAHGICVDTHVHRICNRFKWVSTFNKKEEDTRKELQAWLPRDQWLSINQLLVGFGQQICLPLRPKCDTCLANQLCPSAFKSHLEATKKERNKK